MNDSKTLLPEGMLPKEMKPSSQAFEDVGFTFEETADNVLCNGTLPEGWKTKADCENWLDFIDEKGRERGSIFFKYTFMERRGYMYLTPWFYVHTSDGVRPPFTVSVKNGKGETIFVAGQSKTWYSKEMFDLKKKAKEFLDSNYPDWRNPAKYWD